MFRQSPPGSLLFAGAAVIIKGKKLDLHGAIVWSPFRILRKNSTFPSYYYFYNLTEEAIDNEYNYFMGYALGLLRDDDNETTGSIGEDYIYAKIANPNPKMYPYGTYIGNKYYFMDMQDIPYSKFNMVWESGSFVIDL